MHQENSCRAISHIIILSATDSISKGFTTGSNSQSLFKQNISFGENTQKFDILLKHTDTVMKLLCYLLYVKSADEKLAFKQIEMSLSHNEAKIFLQSIFDFYARTFQYIFAIISDPNKVKVQKNIYQNVLEITRFVYLCYFGYTEHYGQIYFIRGHKK